MGHGRTGGAHRMEVEVKLMNLRNGQITLGELWDDPRSREVFVRRLPHLKKRPIQGRARSVTLGQLEDFLNGWLPTPVIRDVLRDLQKL